MQLSWHKLDKVTSTNDYLQQISFAKNTLYICSANIQSCGRGTHGRHWSSLSAENLYLSLGCCTCTAKVHQADFSLTVAKMVVEVLGQLLPAGLKLQIKAPNDIYIKDRKVGGILIESTVHAHLTDLIVGIGINLNATPQDISTSTSLWSEFGVRLSKEQVTAAIVSAFLQLCTKIR